MRRPAETKITTPFGNVAGYPLNNGFHQGIDYSAFPDPTVFMPEDGKVFCVPWNQKDNNGNMIVVMAGNRLHSLCHLSRFLVSDGFYKEGTPIGIMGETGYAQGRHLHHSVRKAGALINPLSLIEEKIVDKKVTYEFVANASQILLGRKEPVTRAWFDSSVEKDWTMRQLYETWKDEVEAKNFRFKGWDYDKRISELSVLLANAQNKPPEVIIKECEQIVADALPVEAPPAKKSLWQTILEAFAKK